MHRFLIEFADPAGCRRILQRTMAAKSDGISNEQKFHGPSRPRDMPDPFPRKYTKETRGDRRTEEKFERD